MNYNLWANADFKELGAYLNGLIGIKYVTQQGGINQLMAIQVKTKDILEKLDE